ncbi:type II toxin-antitoxin system RelE/ParE family toxin [Pannonibacter sp. Q-1]
MLVLKQTETFRKWWSRLKDEHARGVIASRLDRLSFGHAGDVRAVGDGISELRIHHGPGYRIYFIRNGDEFVLLICGGDKGSQDRDIKAAKRLLAEWKAGDGSPDQHI